MQAYSFENEQARASSGLAAFEDEPYPVEGLEQRVALVSALQCAGVALEDDPDAAAMLLDGVLYAIVAAWYEERGHAIPPRHELLNQLDADAPALAMRLRLALRSPHARARLVHAWALLHDVLDAS